MVEDKVKRLEGRKAIVLVSEPDYYIAPNALYGGTLSIEGDNLLLEEEGDNYPLDLYKLEEEGGVYEFVDRKFISRYPAYFEKTGKFDLQDVEECWSAEERYRKELKGGNFRGAYIIADIFDLSKEMKTLADKLASDLSEGGLRELVFASNLAKKLKKEDGMGEVAKIIEENYGLKQDKESRMDSK